MTLEDDCKMADIVLTADKLEECCKMYDVYHDKGMENDIKQLAIHYHDLTGNWYHHTFKPLEPLDIYQKRI